MEPPTTPSVHRKHAAGHLDDAYDAIDEKAPNATTTIVPSYPRLFMGIDCNAGTSFSSSELTRLNEVADLLRDVTEERVEAAGAGYRPASVRATSSSRRTTPV